MKTKRVNIIKSSIDSVISDSGYELVDIEFRYAKANSTLQVFVDKSTGIHFDDLTFLSKQIGDLLDSKDIIKESYSLEVSSPGIERPLKKIDDYIRFKGKRVKLNLYKPLNGSRSHLLDIKDVNRDMIIFEDGVKDEIPLGLGDIAKANLHFEF